jgi:micrococcal nuclease
VASRPPPSVPWVTWRRASLWLAAFAVVVVVALERDLFGGDDSSPGGRATGVVTRVVDGDTVHVRIDGADEPVRYIGVDTPETVKPRTPVQCYGKAASAENHRLVDHEPVRLRFDAERRDRYGRLLAYVYRASDGLFVNAALIRGGYATVLSIPPNTAHATELAALERRARERRRGLWRRCPSG